MRRMAAAVTHLMFERVPQAAVLTADIGFVNVAAASAANAMLLRASAHPRHASRELSPRSCSQRPYQCLLAPAAPASRSLTRLPRWEILSGDESHRQEQPEEVLGAPRLR